MNVWLTVTNRFLGKRESNKQLINFLEIWHSWHEVMLNYVFSNYSILFYKMREQCLQLFLIMLLPVLYYEGLIHQTKNFICIHSSLFFFVPQERKAALIWKIWKYEKHWQSWQINIYCAARRCLPGYPCQPTGHHFTYHPPGYFAYKRSKQCLDAGGWLCCPN